MSIYGSYILSYWHWQTYSKKRRPIENSTCYHLCMRKLSVLAAILAALIGLAVLIFIGFSSTGVCSLADSPIGLLVVAIPTAVLLVLSLMSIRSGRQSRLAFLYFLLIVAISMFAPASSMGRCKTIDGDKRMTMTLLQNDLHQFFSAHGSYPAALDEFSSAFSARVPQNSFTYRVTIDSYQLCTKINSDFFYYIPTNSGENYCVSP